MIPKKRDHRTRDRIRAYLEDRPGATYREVADALGLSSTSQVHNAVYLRSRQELRTELSQLRAALKTIEQGLQRRPTDIVGLCEIARAALAGTDPERFTREQRLKKAKKEGHHADRRTI